MNQQKLQVQIQSLPRLALELKPLELLQPLSQSERLARLSD
jgi:hypothetical protein